MCMFKNLSEPHIGRKITPRHSTVKLFEKKRKEKKTLHTREK